MVDVNRVIYGITSGDRLVYIGATSQPLRARLAQLKYRREQFCLPKGDLDIFEIERPDDWIEAEQFYIAYFRSIGCDLVNRAIGGQSNTGCTQPDQANQLRREWSSSRRHTEATKQKIGESNRGNKREDLSARNKARARLSDEQVRAIRCADVPQKEIAVMFGISTGMVSMIRSGKRYADTP